MDKKQINQILLGLSLGGFFLQSLSFLLMTLEDTGIVPGLMFWIGLLAGCSLQIVLAVRRRRFLAKHPAAAEKLSKGRIGLLAFATNRLAMVADILMCVGFAATVLAMILTKGTGDICFALIAITVFAFCMHCVLNGKIYRFVMGKLREYPKQKRVNSMEKKEGEGES